MISCWPWKTSVFKDNPACNFRGKVLGLATEVLTLPSNLEYSLKGLLSCWGHCSSLSESVDLLPVLRGLSLKSFFSKSELKSSTTKNQQRKKHSEMNEIMNVNFSFEYGYPLLYLIETSFSLSTGYFCTWSGSVVLSSVAPVFEL